VVEDVWLRYGTRRSAYSTLIAVVSARRSRCSAAPPGTTQRMCQVHEGRRRGIRGRSFMHRE
jgi:hypothetical protein